MKAVGRTQEAVEKSNESRLRRRRKVNPLSPPTTVEIRGVQVHFPFKPYACQETYMGKVMDALFRSENALLESPTGTGKTLCLLCATLAWQREQARLLQQAAELQSSQPLLSQQQQQEKQTISPSRRVPTIIYASRTHSQLSQVLSELRNTRYRPTHTVLGSREQMCVHPKVKTAHATAADINHNCNKLGKERKCRYRNNLDNFAAPANETRYAGERETQAIHDLEDLVEIGQEQKVCPFYYTRSLVENAEFVLLPYNYLFDKDARTTTLADIPWNNAVVIFDEAHNLESFASDSASFDLSSMDIAGCITEVTRAVNYLQTVPDYGGIKLDNMIKLKAIFKKLEDYLLDLDDSKSALSGEFMMEFFRRGGGITHANHEILIEEIRKINDFIMDMRGTGATRGSPKLEHFVQCIKRVYGHALESRCLARASSYRVYISPKTTNQGNNRDGNTTGRTVSYWCFSPALAMEELANLKVRSILVTSGTLSPLPSYSMELGLPFPHTLENPHIISSDQVHVRVIGKGVSGKVLSSSYERRQDVEYFIELGNTLAALAKVIPAGILVFFPSYGVMETCLERWGGPVQHSGRSGKDNDKKNFFAVRRKQVASKQYAFPQTPHFFTNNSGPSTPWKRLLSVKAIVVEPKSSSDLQDAIGEFQRLLSLPKSPGCILMGVCRGKISEGIDFANDMSRAVVITGLPFPPAFDPKVKLKREYLDMARLNGRIKSKEGGGFGGAPKEEDGLSEASKVATEKLSGNEWYTQQAHRAVNQAVGRVIRNRSDYGAVLLLDSRYDQPRNQEGLSKWLRPHAQKDEGFGVAVRSLAQFYKKAESDFKVRVENEKRAAESIELVYEDEEDIDVTKVALVKSENAPNSTEVEHSKLPSSAITYVAPEKVIARLDVKDLNRSTPATNNDEESSEIAPEKKRENAGSKYDKVFVAGNSGKVSQPSNSKEVAAQFMDKIKVNLTPSEQSSIRKAVVAMKTSGTEKDVNSFVLHARSILSIICRYEEFESNREPAEQRMLFLFFRLLPKAHRRRVEIMAMDTVVQSSTISGLCTENLAPSDSNILRRTLASLLHTLWCGEAKKSMSSGDFEKAKLILKILYKAERKVATSMFRAFTQLIPGPFMKMVLALNDEVLAMVSTKELKEADKIKAYDVVSDANAPLLKPVRMEALKQPNLKPSISAPPVPNSQDKAPDPAKSRKRPAAQSFDKSTTKINPYVRKKDATTKTVASSAQTLKKAPSLTNYLQTVVESSETYVKPNPKNLHKAILSNAPKDLVCPLCSNRCKEPFLAECGHMACLSCWLGWLQRSQTCPTCRKTGLTKQSLSKAVFRDHTDASIPTLSQLCTKRDNRDGDDEDSDGELEIG